MHITAVANQKGGCGKTTTAINLAAELAARQRRVLLVDFDPQGHAGLGLGLETEGDGLTLYDVLSEHGRGVELSEIIVPLDDWLYVAPSGITLCALEQELVGLPGRERRLAAHLESLGDLYDHIVIDCPPSTGLLTFNALARADLVVVPVECSLFALEGLQRLLEIIDLFIAREGRAADVVAFVTLFDGRTRYAREVLEDLRRQLGAQLLETVVRANITLREAAGRGLPVRQLAPRSHGAQDYGRLAEELLPRLGPVRREETDRCYPRVQNDEVVFAYPKEYAKGGGVALLGDFNNWTLDEDAVMRDNGAGLLTVHHRLPPGRYQYKFVVEGDWQVDPFNPLVVRTPEGAVNSLVVIADRE